ncbi:MULTISPECIES: MOSC domain-containing protein [unclassified Moraxella]|uniref:MOSC domain-containing protein n=1 Tax=unclassified Moraxella TaxID=2685852 RepID=UPI003AF6B834
MKNLTLPQHIGTLTEVRAGKADLFTREKLSAINKYPIKEPVAVNYMGLLTDEQADRKHHGGHLKAVHQMSTVTYDKINAQFDLNVSIGALGENLTVTIDGEPMSEANVCIGDVYRYGDDDENSVKLKIVQPRRPCYKIDDQVQQYGVASFLTDIGGSGWYFKVVQDGELIQGLPVYLVERPYPFADLATLWQLANQKGNLDSDIVDKWLAIDCLEDSWKKVLAKKRLSSD